MVLNASENRSGRARHSAFPVIVAGAENLAIAISKFVAFGLTGSSAMLTGAIHSVVDTGDQGLLLMGQKLGRRPPDKLHPFGNGMEQYFWSFIVALLIFALGGAASIFEGVRRIGAPETVGSPLINYAVIAMTALFEGTWLFVTLRRYRHVVRGAVETVDSGRKMRRIFPLPRELEKILVAMTLAPACAGAASIPHLRDRVCRVDRRNAYVFFNSGEGEPDPAGPDLAGKDSISPGEPRT